MPLGEFRCTCAGNNVVLGLRGPSGHFVVDPSADRQLEVGDRMLVLGREKDLASMKLPDDHPPADRPGSG